MPKLSAGKFSNSLLWVCYIICHCCLPCIVPDLSVINFRKKCFLDLPVDHAPLLPICPCVSRQASAVSITGHGTVLHSRCSVGICCDDIPSHEVHAYLCSAMVPLSLCLQGTYIGYYCVVCKCTCVWANHLSYMISGWPSVSVVSVVSINIIYKQYCRILPICPHVSAC